jgi:shikimate kinase
VPQQLQRLAHDTTRPLLADTDRHRKLESMATMRTPFYAEIADLIVPQSGEHEGVIAASERCIALIDQHWNRQVA